MIDACSTVRAVVGEALYAAASALATGASNAATIAQSQWRSAHAALRVINHKGLVQFSQELGNVICSGGSTQSPAVQSQASQSVAAAVHALTDYMDALIAGRRDQPMRLLPAYRDLQRARGVEQTADSDLFFPDLNAGPGDRGNAMAITMNSDALRQTRRHLETGLLLWLRKSDDPAGLQQVQGAISDVEAAQSSSRERALWWVASAVLDAVANKGLRADNAVRRFVTQINLHLGRMVQGPAVVPETLMRDALYLAALAQPVTARVEEVQKVCGLQGALDIEEAEVAAFSGEAVAAARRDAEGLKDSWSACVAGAGNTANLSAFAQRIEALESSSQALGQPAFTALLAELAASARTLIASGQPVNEAAALEGACALLMIEHVLEQGKTPAVDFAPRAQNMVARLKVSVRAPETLSSLPPLQLLDDEAQRAQNKQLASLVQSEVMRSLQNVEETLESWFRDSTKTDIRSLDKQLAQVAGALAVMGHGHAAALALQCRAETARYAQGAPCDAGARQILAKRLTGLSTFASEAAQGQADFGAIMTRMGLPVPQQAVPPAPEPAVGTATPAAGPVMRSHNRASIDAQATHPLEIEPPAPAPAVAAPVAGAAVSLAQSENPKGGVERRSPRVSDDVDSRLLPIFLAEAQGLVPQVGQGLREWRARPDDKRVQQSLKRLLHTLKGSARMAGAMALGQLTHDMESRVENAGLLPVIAGSLFDDLEMSFDRIGVLIERLQGTETVDGAATRPAELPEAMDQMSRSMRIDTRIDTAMLSLPAAVDESGADAPATAAGRVVSAQRPLIRVRADLVDRLANQAGEISIARARVSAELRSARATLRDLSENVSRLRTQLGEMEIQAETQMQSRFAAPPLRPDGKFDPLEFDRFTRLQELMRLMAQSVNDVATVQQNLSRDLDESEKALSVQAQMTRDVQQDLMAIRMVPFSSLTDRLYRVTRLAAKDSGKCVHLDIKGGHVELDRSVLERMSAPIEHLLRNAIAHGIETPDRRREVGKADAGELVIEVRQERNEVVLLMSDDGAGLNLGRIREKAVNLGLMRADETLTDQQIGNFIFRTGFSTAGEITAVAGRGVGMDVVMSEISGLGGRVGTAFEHGKGTTFTVHLPLRLLALQGRETH